jgi:branched-chain amino acid transport system ATP-binding protein
MGLRIENISKRFGGILAVSDVSFELPEKSIVGLIGPNGAGKTTLFDIITGFTRADSGAVFIDNRDISQKKPYELTQMGLSRTFQDLRLIYDESVLSNLMLWFQGAPGVSLPQAVFSRWRNSNKFREIKVKAHEFLQKLELDIRASDKAGDLSFGQQKLLSIACCMAAGAQVILLDEPAAGLQNDLKARMQQLLRSMGVSLRGLLFIEHDLDFTIETADEVWVMDEGRIIERGQPEIILSSRRVFEAYIE